MRNPSEANSSNGVFFIDLDEPKNYAALSAFSIFLLLFFPSDEGREFKLHSRLTISKATSWPFFFSYSLGKLQQRQKPSFFSTGICGAAPEEVGPGSFLLIIPKECKLIQKKFWQTKKGEEFRSS